MGRVVDYTDLVALVVVPWSVRFFENHERRRQDIRPWRKALTIPLGLVALVAVSGTSLIPYTREFFLQETNEQELLPPDAVADVLASVAEPDDFECSRQAMRDVDELIEEVKGAFPRRFSDLEYVEPLVERHAPRRHEAP